MVQNLLDPSQIYQVRHFSRLFLLVVVVCFLNPVYAQATTSIGIALFYCNISKSQFFTCLLYPFFFFSFLFLLSRKGVRSFFSLTLEMRY